MVSPHLLTELASLTERRSYEVVTYLINQGLINDLRPDLEMGWPNLTGSSSTLRTELSARLNKWSKYEYARKGKRTEKAMRMGELLHALPGAGDARLAALENPACSFCHPPQAGNRR